MKQLAFALVLAALPAAVSADLVRHVLPEMGTVNTFQVSTGNLYPCIGRPWGMNSWSPVTKMNEQGNERWFYDYTGAKFHGIKVTHQLSPWIGDYCSWSVLPVRGNVAAKRQDRFSWYSHKAETIAPHLYRAYLPDFDATLSLAPTARAAALEVKFGPADAPGLVVDPFAGGEVACAGRRVAGRTVTDIAAPRDSVDPRAFFTVDFDCDVIACEKLADGALLVRFAPLPKGGTVRARLAASYISPDQSALNLKELGDGDLARIASEGRAEWNNLLGRVKVESTDVDRLRVFYTCLYRMLLFPKPNWEVDAEGRVVHWSPADGKVHPGHWYSGTCYWDTFRALFPFLNLVYPEMSARVLNGLENCWREYGWLPEISSPGLVSCMIGNNVASVVADAYLAGVRDGYDVNALCDALVHETGCAHPKLDAIGRRGAEVYLAKGYVPRDIGVKESAARTLEYAYDDWCIAQLFRAVGRPADEVARFERQSRNWRNVFDPELKIARGRNADGSFRADFNPFAWGGDFTEGCAHHYTWSVFQDVPGLAAAMGGIAAFEKRLDEIFAMPPTADHSAYGQVIHEIREMQIMGFGQYAHGNQPIQHMVYLYAWTDAPKKAQHWSREVMNRLYKPSPDGYCGDEDNGQTSAWYVWSALGMYPACPASGRYAFGAPLFERATVQLPNGKTLVVTAPGTSDARRYVAFRTWNGKPLAGNFLTREQFRAGGELACEMSDR